MKIASQELIDIIEESTISKDKEIWVLDIKLELSRKDYLMFQDALKRINGLWNKRLKRHEFNYDPTDSIKKILKTKQLPELNPTAFFPTPRNVIEDMFLYIDDLNLERSSSDHKIKCLEPSSGVGAIAEEMQKRIKNAELDTVEILEVNQDILRAKGFEPHCMDFMEYPVPKAEEDKYSVIMMNPPFSLKGDTTAYMTHIKHAFKMLKRYGDLVAIVPTGWITNKDKKSQEFRDFISEQGTHSIQILEQGTFKESGTNVETAIISLSASKWKIKEYSGSNSFHEWNFLMAAFYDSVNNTKFERMVKSFGKSKIINTDKVASFIADVIHDAAMKHNFLTTNYFDIYMDFVILELEEVHNCKKKVKREKEPITEVKKPIKESSGSVKKKQLTLFDFVA